LFCKHLSPEFKPQSHKNKNKLFPNSERLEIEPINDEVQFSKIDFYPTNLLGSFFSPALAFELRA
jgi:hypothetical protein